MRAMTRFYELAEKTLALEKQGKAIIRLNVGDTGLPVPQCAVLAATGRMTSPCSGYGPAAGLQEFRQMIARREECEPENVVVGPGSKQLIFALLSVLARKGDKVAFSSPHWPMYDLACLQLGLERAVVRTTLEDQWQFAQLPQDAVLAVICNPLNPTSTVCREDILRRVIDQAGRSGMQVILDEAYRGISFTEIPNYSAIRVRSFSKEFNLAGWRLGYVVAPAEIARKVMAYNQITCTCVPEYAQAAGMACLEHEAEILGENRRIWKSRIETAGRALKQAGFGFVPPESGIYFFANHPGIADMDAYALRLLDVGVAVAPGSGFGGYDNFIRICVNQPEAVLEEAIARMGEAV